MSSLVENSTTCNSVYYGIIIACVVLLIVYSFNQYESSCQMQLGFDTTATTATTAPAQGQKVGWFQRLRNRGREISQRAREKLKPKGKLTEGFLEQRALDDNQVAAYEDAEIKEMADYAELGDDVYNSHKEYVETNYDKSQGPSLLNVERDDTNEIVKRVGLRRVNYTGVFQGDDARTTSSEDPDQVAQKTGTFVL